MINNFKSELGGTMQLDQHQIANIRRKLHDSLSVIKIYEWLLNSYVLDFYVDNHWEKMPKSWMQTLSNAKPEHLSDLLVPPERPTEKMVWPLSLLALRRLLQRLCISRKTTNSSHTIDDSSKESNPASIEIGENVQQRTENKVPTTDHSDSNNNPNSQLKCASPDKIKTILMKKKIKAKKQHEIERMGHLTAKIANELNVKYIVDFGSGLGHLARFLAYVYGLNVCCLEKDTLLTDQANELDMHTASLVSKLCQQKMGSQKLVHLNVCLSRETSFKGLIQDIRKSLGVDSNDTTFRFGIIGLHPCGDLASILINFFLETDEPKFLNLVGCCYFKISPSHGCDANENTLFDINNRGYPLSEYLSNNIDKRWHRLSFEAREIACHAIEVYSKRLAQGNYDNLRVHSFRAAIERIICKYWPDRKHSGLRSTKQLTTFREYCVRAVSHLDGVQIPDIDIDSAETVEDLNNWRFVVIFYTLRLMLAPIVESVILYDRMLCLLERGCQTTIEAIFEPVLSARNHITTAIRS